MRAGKSRGKRVKVPAGAGRPNVPPAQAGQTCRRRKLAKRAAGTCRPSLPPAQAGQLIAGNAGQPPRPSGSEHRETVLDLTLRLGAAMAATVAVAAATPARAADPVKIGIIAEQSAIAGASITYGAQIAADEINAAGGIDGRKVELVVYDDHSSATEAVRAFQRLASQDKVVGVIGTYVSEVALALEPWAARMHMPFITTGAASDEISRHVHEDYAHNKYTFHEWTPSGLLAQEICDANKDVLVGPYNLKTAVILSEDAAWTTPLDASYADCLPKVGLKVLDHIRFSPDTTDFTPIFNQIEGKKPDLIVTGISHVGTQPTVQAQAQQVPIAMTGQSSQATSGTFWKDTNGSAAGVITNTAAAPGVAVTPKTIPFNDAYQKRFSQPPSYTGYTTADAVNVMMAAIKRAGSTDPDKMVDALEQTDYPGTIGRIAFYPKDDVHAHAMRYGPDYVQGIMIQWQDGQQKTLWPLKLANAKLAFPTYIHLPQKQASN